MGLDYAGVLDELFGRFKEGYTPEDVASVCSRIHEATGVRVVAVWEQNHGSYPVDGLYALGHSDLAIEREAQFYELPWQVKRHLFGKERLPAHVLCDYLGENWHSEPFEAPADRIRPTSLGYNYYELTLEEDRV